MSQKKALERSNNKEAPLLLEHDIQVACFDWVRIKQNQNELWKNIAACPNGILKNVAAHIRLTKEGFSAGFPDVMVLLPASGYHGLFIEMKRDGGKQSETQKDWQKRLTAVGYCYRLCYSFKEFEDLIVEYVGSDLRKLGSGWSNGNR